MNEADDTYSDNGTEFEPSADDDWEDVDGDD